jgi:alpha-L-rhamnosidase
METADDGRQREVTWEMSDSMTQRWPICCFNAISLLFLSATVCAADSSWKAQWVSLSGQTRPNAWYCFRKNVSLDQKPNEATAKIACDSKYWLWINGKLAVYEGQLKRGPNPRDTYYDRVDLTPYLNQGENQIALLVWYWGKHAFSYNSSGKAGLLFELAADDRMIVTDKTWKAIRHPAYNQTNKPHPNYRLPGDNIHYDATQDIGQWQLAEYNDLAWPHVTEFGRPPAAPWNQLIERPIPQWRTDELTDYQNADKLPKVSTGEPIIAVLPKNITISPYLKINAPKGLTIDIRTDNYKGGGEYNYRAEYVTKTGVQDFESLGYLNGHTVIYTIPVGVEILALQYRQTRYDTDFVGSFECDDPFLNHLWLKARNTMNINMRDGIQDPDRERAQWWGDAVIVQGEILYACDTRAHALIRKAIANLVDWRKSNGVLYSPVPAGNWNKELPQQMLASIGDYGFWYYYLYTGDADTIARAYPAVRRYLSLWKIGKNGLVVHRAGGWDWADWGENQDVTILDNAWYYLALNAAVKMAELTGNARDVKGYQQRMKSIREHFNPSLWTGQCYRSKGYQGITDDRGHGLAVVAGLANPSLWPAIRNVLQQEHQSSPYLEKYVIESLFLMNDADAAIDRMKKRYEKMVNSDVTTLWEGWGIGKEGYGGGSYNHGWAGGPLTLMSQYIAGVAPEQPAFATYHVLPMMGNLRQVKAVVPTVKGNIAVNLEKQPHVFTLELCSPTDTTAIVGIPADVEYQTIAVNNQCVWPIKESTPSDSGVRFTEKDSYYYKFNVAPGRWIFKAETKTQNP